MGDISSGFDFVLNPVMEQEARAKGQTLSAYLEEKDPTQKYARSQWGMDAFQRQLMRHDIRTAPDRDMCRPAHLWGRFQEADKDYNAEQRGVLEKEFIRRQYARATAVRPRGGPYDSPFSENTMGPQESARFPVDAPTTFSLYPSAVYDQLRYAMLQPSMLNLLVARQRTISSESFAATYLTDSTATTAARLSRVDEYGEIPRQKFTTGEQTIRVRKYGGGLDTSYEQLRRMNIDLVSWWVAYVAAKSDRDKEDTAIDVLVNGDGNSGSAATSVSGSTLDAAAAGALTLKMWLMMRLQFVRPYYTTVVVGANASLVTLFLLQAGSANIGIGNLIGNNMPAANQIEMARTTLEGLKAIDNSTVAANTLLLLDGRYSLEMVLEAGSQIVETNKVIQNQYSSIFISENIGWAIAIKAQNKILAFTI